MMVWIFACTIQSLRKVRLVRIEEVMHRKGIAGSTYLQVFASGKACVIQDNKKKDSWPGFAKA